MTEESHKHTTVKTAAMAAVMFIMAAVLSSCAKTSTQKSIQEISLRTPTSAITQEEVRQGEESSMAENHRDNADGVQTKASALDADEIFGVYFGASDSPEGTPWRDAWVSEKPYLENVAFKKSGDTWAGCDPKTGEHIPYYYPLSGSLLAYCYSPHMYSDKARSTISAVKYDKYESSGEDSPANANPLMSIHFTQRMAIGEMVDLKYSRPARTNSGYSFSSTGNNAQIMFAHALSKVNFTIRTDTPWYKIRNVRLMGCVNEAEFYNSNNPGNIPVFTSAHNDGYLIQDEAVPLSSEGIGTDMDMLVVPQYLSGVYPSMPDGENSSGTFVRLEFDVLDKDEFGCQKMILALYSPAKESDRQEDVTYIGGLAENWRSGKHYHYTVTLNPRPVGFGVDVTKMNEVMVNM